MREYGKVHSSFWTSSDIRELGEDGRTLAIYLLSSPHSNMLGCFRMPIAYVSEDLQWTQERVKEGFAKLFGKGFATLSEGLNWVVIHKYLKWNAMENPNVVKSSVKIFDQIPNDGNVKALLVKAIREYEPRFPTEKLNPFDTLCEPFAKGCLTEKTGFRKPEPEPEPEPEPKEAQQQASNVGDADETVSLNSPVSRAIEIATYLRKRGIVGANSANPNISGWGDDVRVTNEILDAALSVIASRQLENPVGPNYLVGIIRDLLNQKPAKSIREDNSWKRTHAGIERKASELAISCPPGRNHDWLLEKCESVLRQRNGETT